MARTDGERARARGRLLSCAAVLATAVAACAAAGCYGPSLADGQYSCPDGVCPSGFACTKCGRCVKQGEPIDDAPCGPCMNGACPAPQVCTDCGLCQPAGTAVDDRPCHRDGCTAGAGRRDAVDPDLPNLAFCAAAWDVPGVVDATVGPRCNRAPGMNGAGCAVADNCAAGWHVCLGDADAAAHGLTRAACLSVDNQSTGFYATRQRGDLDMTGAFFCSSDATVANDLYGCGVLPINAGLPSPEMCTVLTSVIGRSDCDANDPPWSCGTDMDLLVEGELAVKSSLDLGGVLCCRD